MADYIPAAVQDYLREFYAAVKVGRVHEIAMLCDRGFRDISARYYENSAWPTAREISEIVKHDPVFLTLYKTLYFRSLLNLSHPDRRVALTHHADSWTAHREFFELLMDPRASAELELPSAWLYDVLCNEIPYRCETFHSLLTSSSSAAGAPDRDGPEGDDAFTHGSAAVVHAGVGADAGPPGGLDDAALQRAWGIPQLMGLLHDIVDSSRVCTTATASGLAPTTLHQTAGYFALVALCRMYTKLGDYAAAVESARPLCVLAGEGLFTRNPACHLAISYYLGFALIMCRRFDDAFKVLSRTLLLFHRVHRVLEEGARGYMRIRSGRMLELLALCVAVLPGATLDEQLRKVLRERHSNQLERISSGEGMSDIEDIFAASAPGYLAVRPTAQKDAPPPGPATNPDAVMAAHLQLLKVEIGQRVAGASRLRSYMRLYTSIDLPKLADLCHCSADDARAMLTSLKVKAWAAGPGLALSGAGSAPASVDPLHFFVVLSSVHIEEAKQARDYNGFFIRSVDYLTRVARDAEKAIVSGGIHGHGQQRYGAPRQQQHNASGPANAWRR